MQRYIIAFVLSFTLLNFADFSLTSATQIQRWLSQTVYVPLYSHIYVDERFRDKPFNLTATLSIRNTDPEIGIKLIAVDYYDSSGKKLRSYLDNPVAVPPLGSTRYIVQDSDTAGGSGAKFLVKWSAQKGVAEPIIESIMIGTKMQQGISFVSRGKVIKGQTEEMKTQ